MCSFAVQWHRIWHHISTLTLSSIRSLCWCVRNRTMSEESPELKVSASYSLKTNWSHYCYLRCYQMSVFERILLKGERQSPTFVKFFHDEMNVWEVQWKAIIRRLICDFWPHLRLFGVYSYGLWCNGCERCVILIGSVLSNVKYGCKSRGYCSEAESCLLTLSGLLLHSPV